MTRGQEAVLSAFREFGPMTDVALATYVHHVSSVPMSSSGIRTRRSELVRMDMLTAVDRIKLKSGRFARIHALTDTGRNANGNSSLPNK